MTRHFLTSTTIKIEHSRNEDLADVSSVERELVYGISIPEQHNPGMASSHNLVRRNDLGVGLDQD